jgi:uncharacterized protein
MASNAPPERVRIAVFAKAPVPGEVKTRLRALLGDAGAASLHASLVRRALAVAVGSGVGPVELHCAPHEGHPFFASCVEEFPLRLERQRGADLGERMRGAFQRAGAEGDALIVLGSDCPALGIAHLRAARAALADHDAVIVPAEDGGYVLIGLNAPCDALFEGIDWGSDTVLAQTRTRLAHANLRWAELPALWDVDRPEDYARLAREGILAERVR